MNALELMPKRVRNISVCQIANPPSLDLSQYPRALFLAVTIAFRLAIGRMWRLTGDVLIVGQPVRFASKLSVLNVVRAAARKTLPRYALGILNERTSGHRAVAFLFHAERLGRAVPECECSALSPQTPMN